jgi:hypothetical protein
VTPHQHGNSHSPLFSYRSRSFSKASLGGKVATFVEVAMDAEGGVVSVAVTTKCGVSDTEYSIVGLVVSIGLLCNAHPTNKAGIIFAHTNRKGNRTM